jgi:hypothetical protein
MRFVFRLVACLFVVCCCWARVVAYSICFCLTLLLAKLKKRKTELQCEWTEAWALRSARGALRPLSDASITTSCCSRLRHQLQSHHVNLTTLTHSPSSFECLSSPSSSFKTRWQTESTYAVAYCIGRRCRSKSHCGVARDHLRPELDKRIHFSKIIPSTTRLLLIVMSKHRSTIKQYALREFCVYLIRRNICSPCLRSIESIDLVRRRMSSCTGSLPSALSKRKCVACSLVFPIFIALCYIV